MTTSISLEDIRNPSAVPRLTRFDTRAAIDLIAQSYSRTIKTFDDACALDIQMRRDRVGHIPNAIIHSFYPPTEHEQIAADAARHIVACLNCGQTQIVPRDVQTPDCPNCGGAA